MLITGGRCYRFGFILILQLAVCDNCYTFCIPGSTPGVLIMENIMEKIARTLDKDPTDVKQLNYYTTGQVREPAYRVHTQ